MQLMDLASATVIIASISVVVGVILALLQLRDQVKNRQAQLVVQLYNQFSDTEFLENVDYTLNEYENFDPESFSKNGQDAWNDQRMISVLIFFEGIGVLAKRKLIDINLVGDMLSTPIIMVWKTLEPRIKASRKALQREQVGEWFEFLYEEIQKIPSRSWRV